MRKMVKFASLCLAATLSMTTVLTAVPQNVRTVMADDETDNRQGGSESFEGNAKTLHYAYDASTKKLTLTGSFEGGDVFELLDDYIIFEKTEIDDIYADFSLDCSYVTFKTGVERDLQGKPRDDSEIHIENLFESISFGPEFIATMNNLDSYRDMFKSYIRSWQSEKSGFKKIDLSGWNTSNINDMSGMFSGCQKLTDLDLTGFDTENVHDMSYMFFECTGLDRIDVSGFNTENVDNMSYMFCGCSSFTELNVDNFDTKKVNNMTDMFGCEKLKKLDITKFNTENVYDMRDMFSGCSSLTDIDLSNLCTERVHDMSGMFSNCSSLTDIDLNKFKTDNVEDMSYMFYGCSGLSDIDLSSLNTQNVSRMDFMFCGCVSITALDISNFDMKSNPSLIYLFDGCDNLRILNMGFDMPDEINEILISSWSWWGHQLRLHEIVAPKSKNKVNNKTLTFTSDMYSDETELYESQSHENVKREKIESDEEDVYKYTINIDDQPHTYIFSTTHEWDNAPHSATCTEKSATSMCTICGERIGTEGEALGHIPGSTVIENRVEPTYDKEGGYDEVVYCTRDDNGCGHSELSRKHVVLEKLKKPESTDDKKDDSKKDESTGETKPSDTKKDDSTSATKPSASKTDDSASSSKPSSTASTKTTYADGLNQINGEWVYCKNDKIDTSYTGLCKYNGSWWYVKNGKVDFSATTLCKYNGSWFYVSGGKVNFNYTGLCKYNGSWWYIKGGQVSFTTTLCKYNGSWWYVKNGQVDFKTAGLCKYNGAWWYVKGGKVSFTTTLCKYNGTWWYVKNGKVDFSSTTLCKYGNAWYCVSGGKVAWSYSGTMKYNGGTYNVVNGIVKF